MSKDKENKKYAFDVNESCYCSICERRYKNYSRFKAHLLKKHFSIDIKSEISKPFMEQEK